MVGTSITIVAGIVAQALKQASARMDMQKRISLGFMRRH
jgi:hypothetical protein